MNDELYADITVEVYLADVDTISDADYEVDVDALYADIKAAIEKRLSRYAGLRIEVIP